MARKIKPAPTLKRHKRSKNGYARFNGRQFWFGPFDDPESHSRFAAFKARWEANGREVPTDPDRSADFSVADLIALYLQHAEVYYRRADGSQTQEVPNIRYSVRPLLELYGSLPASAFDLRGLKVVRETMIASGLARTTVNIRVGRIVRIFGWGAEEEFVPSETFGVLRALRPLRRGRSLATETKPIRAVPWKDVKATLEHLTSTVRDMVLVLWYTGMRPGEVRQISSGAIDQTESIWHYRPTLHKTQHHGRVRSIAIGPRAQEVLRPYLSCSPKLDPEAPLFSPKASMADRHAKAASKRRTPRPSNPLPPKKKDSAANGQPGLAYGKDSFARAIARASRLAGVPHWTPNQLRHAAATRIRKELGLDSARAVLGHTSSETTEVYAELDLKKAEEAMKRLG